MKHQRMVPSLILPIIFSVSCIFNLSLSSCFPKSSNIHDSPIERKKKLEWGSIMLDSLFPFGTPNFPTYLHCQGRWLLFHLSYILSIFHLGLYPHGFSEITVVGALVLNWMDRFQCLFFLLLLTSLY